MSLFRRAVSADPKIKAKVLNRLRNTSDQELIRWIDNIHTGMGRNISEMRKNLNPDSRIQALIYIQDIRAGAVSMMAAMQVMEERFSQQTGNTGK